MSVSPTLPFDRTQIKPGDRICVAVSGGADSVALLLTLHAANAAKRDSLGVGLSAVHINHNLRGEESKADQQFVEDLCIALDIPLHLHHADIPARIATTKESIEEAARNARYDFFNTLLASGHADSVLTAHTLDDQAETVLMKLLRGAWTEGLSAIHPVITLTKGKILRPFLQTRRAEIEFFLKSINQPWREDSTNSDTAFTRNKIRHELLPACGAHRIGVLPYFPLASGLLTGKYQRGEAPGKDTRLGLWGERGARLLSEDAFTKVERFEAFAKQRGKTLLDLAFGWLLSQREIPSVIAGATKPEQVESNVKAGEYRLSPEDMLAFAPLL